MTSGYDETVIRHTRLSYLQLRNDYPFIASSIAASSLAVKDVLPTHLSESASCPTELLPTITEVTFAVFKHPSQRHLGQRLAAAAGYVIETAQSGHKSGSNPVGRQMRSACRTRAGRNAVEITVGQHTLLQRRECHKSYTRPGRLTEHSLRSTSRSSIL